MTQLPEKRSPEDIRALAQQMVAQTVFFLEHVPPELVQMVFMPVAFGAFADWTEEEISKVAIFETADKAGPRSVKGYPMFFSCQVWLREDVLEAQDRARAAIEAINTL